jgi:hypothetical protein
MRGRLSSIPIAAGLWAAGCSPGDPADAPALGTIASKIRNGTREPQVVPLSEGEKLAVGWLHTVGWAEGNFCTGTVIGPRVVATAKHCTADQTAGEIGFSVGLLPTQPNATFNVAEIHEHPQHDVALLILDRDVLAAVPALVPIAFNRAALDDSIVGREVDACGYGETYDASRTGRYFARLELVQVDPVFIRVDGRGQQGICFGDSGGPVLTAGADGTAVVLGVEHGGDSSCLGVDALTRLDVVASWIDGIATTVRPGEDPGAACGGVDYQGACEGDVAVWCDAGRLARRDCRGEGRVCGFVDDETGFYCREPDMADPCGGETADGRCEGDVVVRCDAGQVFRDDCAAQGARCTADGGGAVCERRAPVPGPDGDAGVPAPLDDATVSTGALPGSADDLRETRKTKYEGGGCAQAGDGPSGAGLAWVALAGLWRRRRRGGD